MNILDQKINLYALFTFSHIAPSTLYHLKKVYASFALCIFLGATGACTHMVTHIARNGFLSTIGSMGLVLWLMVTSYSHETEQRRLGVMAAFAFLTGTGLIPALDLNISVKPSLMSTSFLGSAMIFSCFTLSALCARHRSYVFLGGILMSAMSLTFFSSLGNLFVGSILLFHTNLYIGLAVMCSLVLFDTQLIIEKAENGDKDYIWHCVELCLDFAALLQKIMMILATNRKYKKKEKI